MNLISSQASHKVHLWEWNWWAWTRVFLLLDQLERLLFFAIIPLRLIHLNLILHRLLWHMLWIGEHSIIEMTSSRLKFRIMLLNVIHNIFMFLFRNIHHMELLFGWWKQFLDWWWWLEGIFAPFWDVLEKLFLFINKEITRFWSLAFS